MPSRIGFGTYRCDVNNPYHEEALRYALERGITLIDTSANYMFGNAERLIGKVLKDVDRDKITVVSKGGYIQGDNMDLIRQGKFHDELVRYDPHCYHSIHPEFLSDQIERSLKRLDVKCIDIYLLHNPEYYLMHEIKAQSNTHEVKEHQEQMQERIQKAFVLLEEKVSEGKIKGYGISSNSFSKYQNHKHFLEYRHLVEHAKKAAGGKHHLKALQLPMNMLENQGEDAAKWAHSHHLKVLINRPLNALSAGGMVRLAEYDLCDDIDGLKSELMHCNINFIAMVINELESFKNRFRWAGELDDTLEYQVLPMIARSRAFENDHQRVLLLQYVECYKQRVKQHLSLSVKALMEHEGRLKKEETLQHAAVEFLLSKKYVDVVLMGLRQKNYVENIRRYI